MSDGCPDGMYPLDSTYELNEYDSFEELQAHAERMAGVLNLPLSWHFAPDKDDPDPTPSFELVFLMPRKGCATWGLRTKSFDRAEVQAWLDTWLREQINTWFGWMDGAR